MPLTDPPPASVWPMGITLDLQKIENPPDAYIKKCRGGIKTFKHDIKKMQRSYDFACLFPENKEVYQLFFVAVRLQR